jgi:hypothetical protein
VAAFLTPAPDTPAEAPSSGAPSSGAPLPGGRRRPNGAAATPDIPRQSGLRPKVAAFIDPSAAAPVPEAPSSGAPIHATPAGHSAPRSRSALPEVALPGWLTARLHSVRGLTTFALVVLAIVAVIGGGVWAGGKLVGNHRNDNAVAGPAGAAGQTLSTLSGTAPPVGRESLLNDSLSQPGAWHESSKGKGLCRFDQATLVAERDDRVENAEYRCAGPTVSVTDDFVLTVATTLRQDSSCAGIWFHASTITDGQMLQICPDGLTLLDGSTTVGRFTTVQPITPGQKVAIVLAVQGKKASVWQDGLAAGSVMLRTDDPVSGQVQLGISVAGGDQAPPYSVGFADFDLRGL